MLTAWNGADFARDIGTRRSRPVYAVFLGIVCFCWFSKLQTSVVLSITEAKFDALAVSETEVFWSRVFITEIVKNICTPTIVFEDNLVWISWTETVQGLRNIKHVCIKYQ